LFSFIMTAAGASSLVIAAQTSLVALPQLSRSLLAMFRSRTALLDPAYLNMIRISAAPPSTKLLLPVGHPLAVKAGMVYHSGMAQIVGACVGVAVLDGMAMLFDLEAEKGGEKERGVKPEDVVRGTLGGLGVGWVLREIANVRMKATPAYVGLAGLPGLAVGMVYYFLSVSLSLPNGNARLTTLADTSFHLLLSGSRLELGSQVGQLLGRTNCSAPSHPRRLYLPCPFFSFDYRSCFCAQRLKDDLSF
jgi:hypothetical protein